MTREQRITSGAAAAGLSLNNSEWFTLDSQARGQARMTLWLTEPGLGHQSDTYFYRAAQGRILEKGMRSTKSMIQSKVLSKG